MSWAQLFISIRELELSALQLSGPLLVHCAKALCVKLSWPITLKFGMKLYVNVMNGFWASEVILNFCARDEQSNVQLIIWKRLILCLFSFSEKSFQVLRHQHNDSWLQLSFIVNASKHNFLLWSIFLTKVTILSWITQRI